MATESSLLLKKKNNPGFIPESTFLRFTLLTFLARPKEKDVILSPTFSLSATPSSRGGPGMFVGYPVECSLVFYSMDQIFFTP